MLRLILLATVVCVTCLAPTDSNAAEITVWDQQIQGKSVIQIDGPIVSGDEDKFRTVSREHTTAFVVLRSNGGQLRPALDMGRLIRLAGYETVVLGRDECASACALIWAAGSTRWLSDAGRVGFHASYRNENGQPVESGVANALIGHYLSVLGYPAKSVVFATSASPTEILWLTSVNRTQSGFSFEKLSASWDDIGRGTITEPPPIVISPATPKPDHELDWRWGSSVATQTMKFEDHENGDLYHVLVPVSADRDSVAQLLNEYVEGRWIWYSSGASGTESFFDIDSISASSLGVWVWIKFEYKDEQSSKSLVRIDCPSKIAFLRETVGLEADGTASTSWRAPSRDPAVTISPESHYEELYRTLCWKS